MSYDFTPVFNPSDLAFMQEIDQLARKYENGLPAVAPVLYQPSELNPTSLKGKVTKNVAPVLYRPSELNPTSLKGKVTKKTEQDDAELSTMPRFEQRPC